VERPGRETFYFSRPVFFNVVAEILQEFIGLGLQVGTELAPNKPFPGISPRMGKILLGAFLVTCMFTGFGTTIIDLYFYPVSDALSVLLILSAWVLFLLLLSTALFYYAIKGVFL
jgi:hypothetical protein